MEGPRFGERGIAQIFQEQQINDVFRNLCVLSYNSIAPFHVKVL